MHRPHTGRPEPFWPSAAFCTIGLTALVVTAGPLQAQGWIDIERPTRPGIIVGDVARVDSRATITVDGRVAAVQVEERFRNQGGTLAEGSYLYPLPGEAVFNGFSLWMGSQELRGETMDAERARSIYEEIVRRKRDPALLTLAGHGLMRAQVFPIQPGETRKVALRYTQLLTRSGDALRLRYALGVRGTEASTEVRVVLTDPAAYGTPYSPTHTIDTRERDGRMEIVIQPGGPADIELFLPLRRGLAGAALVTHAPGGEDGYFMLLLSPPPVRDATVVPRDVTLVVDVSGSMSGAKLEQAKAALEQALGTLDPADRFRLVAFSSGVRPFRPEPVSATREHLAEAREFINGLAAEGGTNIAGALEAALASSGDAERLSLIIFVTDGLPSVGEQSPDRIAEAAAARVGRARIFPIGIGHDVNTYLLDRLATQGRGSVEYVPPGASVETAMGSVLAKLRHPALVDLRLGDAPVTLTASYPTRLPDLFFGEELVVFGRYRGQGRGTVEITGSRGGRRERLTVEAGFPVSENDNDFIPKLWASRRIGELTRQVRLEGGSAQLVQEIRQLGLRYGIVTEYTSYLVEEPGAVTAQAPAREDVQTGVKAFERARASAKFSEAKSLRAADAAADARLEGLIAGSTAPDAVRRVAGRVFVRRGEVWTDMGHAERMPVTAVAAFSPAYFELVRMLPELAPCLPVGPEVLLAGRRGSIQVGATGIQVWAPGQLQGLVNNFRGT